MKEKKGVNYSVIAVAVVAVALVAVAAVLGIKCITAAAFLL